MSDEIPVVVQTVTFSEGARLESGKGYYHAGRHSPHRIAIIEAIEAIPAGTYKPEQGNTR